MMQKRCFSGHTCCGLLSGAFLWLNPISDLRFLILDPLAWLASFCCLAASLRAELRAMTISLACDENRVKIPSARPQFLKRKKIALHQNCYWLRNISQFGIEFQEA